MLDRRPDDPNDRIAHQHRRSLRASWVLFAWLAELDPSSINSLDSYVEQDGRHFVRHYIIDFGATLGSASTAAKGLAQTGEVHGRGRAHAQGVLLARAVSPAVPGPAREWKQTVAERPSLGWFPRRALRSGRLPHEPQGPRPHPAHGSRSVLGRQARHVVLRRADRGDRRDGAHVGRRHRDPDARAAHPARHHRPALSARGSRRSRRPTCRWTAAASASTTWRCSAATRRPRSCATRSRSATGWGRGSRPKSARPTRRTAASRSPRASRAPATASWRSGPASAAWRDGPRSSARHPDPPALARRRAPLRRRRTGA